MILLVLIGASLPAGGQATSTQANPTGTRQRETYTPIENTLSLGPAEMQTLLCYLLVLGVLWLAKSTYEACLNARVEKERASVERAKAESANAAALLKLLTGRAADQGDFARFLAETTRLKLDMDANHKQVSELLEAIQRELTSRAGAQ